jgi:hypothetical protein
MSRKFDRSHKIQHEASKVLTNPAVMRRLFKKKPWWMRKFVWKVDRPGVLLPDDRIIDNWPTTKTPT